MAKRLPLVLLILDGWGIGSEKDGNAIAQAKITNIPALKKKFGFASLRADGVAVGLPPKQVGNSEAGHLNIGAGRVVEQDAVRINHMIRDGRFKKNPAFLNAIHHMRKYKGRLHFMGLLTGNGSGHAFPEHLDALLQFAQERNVSEVYLHLFTDGRDTTQYEAASLVAKLQKKLSPQQHIATVMGRLWAMDRAKRWDRTAIAFHTLTNGGKAKSATTAEHAVLNAYKRRESDEFIAPTVVGDAKQQKESRIRDNDVIIFFNLRSDRARQMSKAFVQESFEKMNPGAFTRRVTFSNLKFIAMTDFGPDLQHILTAFPSVDVPDTLPMQLSDLRQLYVAEGEKYAHITYFFNGGYADPVGNEQREIIHSADVQSFIDKPSMETPQIAKRIMKAIQSKKFDIVVANFANADMVGHTGDLQAGITAVKIVDTWVGKIWEVVDKAGGTLVITADHGNIETMLDAKTGQIDTAHNSSPVPLIIASSEKKVQLKKTGKLADIAPTVLRYLGRIPPKSMTGTSLIKK